MNQLSIPCASVKKANEFATFLRTQHELDVTSVTGAVVNIPFGGDPMFAFGVGDLAFDNGFAHDSDVARAVSSALEGSPA